MKPLVIKKALDAWPAWHASILEARKNCGFRTEFTELQYREWKTKARWKTVVKECLEALDNLWLPWWFADYWLNCFWGGCGAISSSKRLKNERPWRETLEDVLRNSKLKFYAGCAIFLSPSDGKVAAPAYPFLLDIPFFVGTTRGQRASSEGSFGWVELERGGNKERIPGVWMNSEEGTYKRAVFSVNMPAKHRFTAYFAKQGNSPSPLLLRLEVPIFLATEDVLKEAFRQIQFYRDGFLRYVTHPLSGYMQRVKLARGGKEEYIGEDLSKYERGDISFVQLLRSEFKNGKGAEGLNTYKELYGLDGAEYKEKEAEYAHLVYRRVRQRFHRRGIKPEKPERSWWKHLTSGA